MRRGLTLALALAFLLPVSLAAEPAATAAANEGYERLYSGDSEGAYRQFRDVVEREPDSLEAAFGVLQALDAQGLGDSARQQEFEARSAALIGRAKARYDKNKQDRDAAHYLGLTYAALAAYKFEQSKGMWGAARDAAKAKGYAEESVRLEPGRGDAYFTLGLYNYYVDIASGFVKALSFILFLPTGNRAEGLKQIERAAREGELMGPAASAMLVQIYAFLEGRPEEALRMATELKQKYPENPEFNFLLARVQASPAFEDYEAAEKTYRAIVARAEQGHAQYKGGARYTALNGLARVQAQSWELQQAVATLTPTIEASVQQPDWVLPSFLLARGNYRALLNDPKAAEDTRRVAGETKWKRWQEAAKRQLKWGEERQKSGEAAVYTELIPGNRLVAQRRWEEAVKLYDAARQKHPDDWQVRYRLAYMEFARGEIPQAATLFSGIVYSNPGKTPSWLKANSLLWLARIHDLRGERDQAVRLYKRVVSEFEDESASGGARVGLLTPYRRSGN